MVLWRAGLRIREALTLAETDLNERRRRGRLGRGERTAIRLRSTGSRTDRSVSWEAHNDSACPAR